MTSQVLVFAILIAALGLFLWGRWRHDMVAMIALLAAVILFTTLFATITVVDDRQQGWMQSALVAPGSRFALVLGEVAGVTTQVFIQCVLFVAIAPLAGFPLPAINWLALVAVIGVASVGLTAMNYTVAWLVDSQRGYHAIMMIALLPLWFLSGALFPPPDNWLRWLMLVNPVAHACDGIRGALNEGALGVAGVLDTSLGPVTESLLVLTVFAVLMLGVATHASRRPESA